MDTHDLAVRFSELGSQQGYTFECQPIPGEVEVLEICLSELQELPVYLSVTDTQVLCITYLWTEDEVRADLREAMLETMLVTNIPMPLSAFAKIDDRYVLFGALSNGSAFDDIVHEVVTLCENAVEVIEAMEEFLN